MEKASSNDGDRNQRDLWISIVAILFIIVVDLFLYLKMPNFAPVVALVLLTLWPLSCLAAYLVIRRRQSIESGPRRMGTDSTTRLLLTTLFLVFTILSILSVQASVAYERSILFFIFSALAISTISIEIYLGDGEKWRIPSTIGKILLTSVILRVVPMTLIPGLYGDDPLYHQTFTSEITSENHIPLESAYSTFPMMHITIGAVVDITGFDFKAGAIFSVTLFQAVLWPILLFMVVRKVTSSDKVALFSALIMGFADVMIGYGILGAFPTTFALLFVLLTLYLVIDKGRIRTNSRTALLILFVVMIVLSHSLTALLMILSLVFLLGMKTIQKRSLEPKMESGLKNGFVTVSALIVLGYWILVANFIFDKFINVIFLNEGVFASFVTSAGRGYAETIPVLEYSASLLGEFLVYGFAITGFLFCFSRKSNDLRLLALTVISLVLLAIGGFGQILALGVAPDRILYYCFIFIPIPAAYGLFNMVNRIGKNRKLAAITVASLFLITSFFMITAPQADVDSPVYSRDLVSPRFITQSERLSVDSILSFRIDLIGTDNDISALMTYLGYSNATLLDFHSTEFTSFDGPILIREFYETDPIYSRGLYRLDQSALGILNGQQFNKIFDSDAIILFVNRTIGESIA